MAVSEPVQARDLVRGKLLAFGNGVARYSGYNFMDSGTDPANVEHRFGLVRNTQDTRGALVPKPSYVATAVLARPIDELPLIGQTKFSTNGYDVAFNAGGGQSVHAVWSATPGLVNAAAPAGSTVQVTYMYGAVTTLTTDAGGPRITDDVFSQPNRNGNIWGGDGLQIGMTAGAPGEATRTQEIGAALTDVGTVDTWRWSPVELAGTPLGVQAKVVRDASAHTTNYEVAIPWSTLEFASGDRLLSTTVVVNENDGTGRRGWLTWGTGVAEAKNPAGFNAIRLDATPAAPVGATDATFGITTTARPQCWSGAAVLPVYAYNAGSAPMDVRFTTPLGEQKISSVAAGKGAYYAFSPPVAPWPPGRSPQRRTAGTTAHRNTPASPSTTLQSTARDESA
jgi:hypothetical protein